MTPKITLDNFKLMGDDTTYWLENFDVEKIGGKNVLKTSYNQLKKIDTASNYGTGFTNLNYLLAMDSFVFADGTKQTIGFTGEYMFMFDVLIPSNSKGQIHQLSGDGTGVNKVQTSSYPDIHVTKEGHVLYTSANHTGIGWYGKCKAGSGTTKIVDSAGRNFTTLGVLNVTSGNNSGKYVYNLTNKTRYTITSVSTTTSTNDTLNFAAGESCDENDEFIVFVDNQFSFNTSTVRDNHFVGQPASNNFKRQIEFFGSDYWILNGNYVATLNIDLTTWAYDAKQLTYATQATTISGNNSNLLIGGEYKGAGKTLLWDSYSDGFNSIMDVDLPPQAIYFYDNGWMYTDGLNIFFTNGYQKQLIAKLPDSNPQYSYNTMNFNSFIISGKQIYINSTSYHYNRLRYGLYIYDLENEGFIFSPYYNKDGKTEIAVNGNTGFSILNYSNQVYFVLSTDDAISCSTRDSSGSKPSTATFFIKLPQKMRLSKLELNVDNRLNEYLSSLGDSYSTDIYLSIGQGRRPMWGFVNASDASTTSSIVNTSGATKPAKVGQKIMPTSLSSGGDISWITVIANPGEATETWTISPVLSNDIGETTSILVEDVYTQGKRTITYDSDLNFNNTLQWEIKDFYSDKLFIDVYIKSDNTFIPLQINSVNIY